MKEAANLLSSVRSLLLAGANQHTNLGILKLSHDAPYPGHGPPAASWASIYPFLTHVPSRPVTTWLSTMHTKHRAPRTEHQDYSKEHRQCCRWLCGRPGQQPVSVPGAAAAAAPEVGEAARQQAAPADSCYHPIALPDSRRDPHLTLPPTYC